MSTIYILFRDVLGAVKADQVQFFFFLTYKSEADYRNFGNDVEQRPLLMVNIY